MNSLRAKEAELYQPAEVTFVDPRTFDGNPYEVAAMAVGQVEGVLAIYLRALDAAFLMARNAQMERNLDERNPPAGDEYLLGPQGRIFTKMVSDLEDAKKQLALLKRAVAYDPKHPPKA